MSVKTICMANFKGGVGKTTSTMNIGYALANKDYKVCFIDLDPQANLTISMGLDYAEPSTYELIVQDYSFKDVRKKISDNISILPSHISLIKADIEISAVYQRECLLANKLNGAKNEFDFILIDCPPNLGIVTVNGIVMSDYIFTPIEAEFLALKGFSVLNQAINKVKVDIDKIFITKFDKRKILNREIAEGLEKSCGEKLFNTKIRDNISLAESQSQFMDIFSYDSKSYGSLDYLSLTDEILEYIGSHEENYA